MTYEILSRYNESTSGLGKSIVATRREGGGAARNDNRRDMEVRITAPMRVVGLQTTNTTGPPVRVCAEITHNRIPRGRKENDFCVISNAANVTRIAQGQRSSFDDDCGVWETTTGRTNRYPYPVAYLRGGTW